MPCVYNKRVKSIPIPMGAVLVDRTTPFGNPFIIGRDGSREEVIEKFKQAALNRSDFMSLVRTELKGKDLVCWCAPEACHADVLLELANSDTEKPVGEFSSDSATLLAPTPPKLTSEA